ncbi:MAG: competence protein CoiA family protein [Nostoc sp.]|uniref:competence protein CoiA n=1 Tax=Nostoc sp. TaxID=1180 RepID=UPI002FF3D95F
MRYALVNGQKLEAQKGIIDAVCPCCGNPVIPNCGPIKIHHWSHKNLKDCDSWYEPITEWHINWQNLFPEECREVVMGNHRADVVYKSCVLEFQHSFISADNIKEREAFYKNMTWVFDFSGKYSKNQLKLLKKNR